MTSTRETSSLRNSSIELLRIVAMFFVVIVHCNGWLVGGLPNNFDETNISIFRSSQAIIQAFTCTCVNLFLLISSYFGLNLKFKSIMKIIMVLISVSIPFYFVNCIAEEQFSARKLLTRLMVISRSGYFVECYLLLMFFSPLLNAFIKEQGRRVITWVLLFWAIEVYFEFIIHDEDLGFKNGYSFIHFVLIYMIGRSLYIYKEKLHSIESFKYMMSYILCTCIIFMSYMFFDMLSAFSYCSPFNIIASCSIFVLFTKYTFYNRVINWVASSTFTVYIIHTQPPVFNWLKSFDNFALTNYTYPKYVIMMGGVVTLVFWSSILYDKIARLITVPIVDIIDTNLKKCIPNKNK